MLYPEPIAKLITALNRLPGIGPKSAQRLAFYILGQSPAEVRELLEGISEVKSRVRYCSVCFNLTVNDPCAICADEKRNPHLLCVVAEPKDLIAIEKTGEYGGRYHVLGGVLSPLDNRGTDNLKIKELMVRLEKDAISEIIMAINPTVEGEATLLYLGQLIQPLGIKVTRIAYGLPVGADMDYADEVTLSRAFEGRVSLN